MSRRGGRLTDLLWAAPLGICLIYAAAVYDNPKLGRRLLASVGLPVATPTATFGEASGEGRLINDGTRLKGRLQGGDGNCGGRYCDPQMDYTFDVSVLQ